LMKKLGITQNEAQVAAAQQKEESDE
jgi:hypothetical protein